MWAALLLSILTLSELDPTQSQFSNVLEPYDFLFDNALEAYSKQDWLSVILNMERALRNKATVRKVRTDCRLSCANRTNFGEPLPGAVVPVPGLGPVEDLGFFQRFLNRAECVSACENEKLGPMSLHKVTAEMDLEFKKRTPYNYLQVAYFKINKLDKAVAAANTFYVANPDHVEMRQNLEYYSMMAGVQASDFKDLEARPHMAEFLEGKRLYSADDFSSAIDHFEAALKEFFIADEECRVLCEGAYDYDGNYMEYKADLFQSITDHYLHVLNCKQNCVVELASTAGKDKPFEDFLPSHFNYLQFSYYNSEKYEKAIECARTYLLFHPEDKVMQQNMAYYSVMLGEDKGSEISARENVQQYIRKSLLEKELLYFGYEIFGVTFVDPDTWTPEEVMPKKLREKQKADRETAARITEEISNLMKEIETLVEEKTKETSDVAKIINNESSNPETPSGENVIDGVTVTMTSEALNGSQRVVLDGVITDDECKELRRLSSVAAQTEDVSLKPNPYMPSEMIQEVTLLKALKLGQEGVIPLKSAQMLFDLSERVRKVVEPHFSLELPLFLSHSHLVCRSAIEEKKADGGDSSQTDNCLLISELNECIKDPSEHKHQDYRAVLYLNNDFELGDFVFTGVDGKTVTAAVKPQCGRVVVLGAEQENLHGVQAVAKGQRCAVALRFTLDPQQNEKERLEVEELLKTLSSPVDSDLQKSETPFKSESSEPTKTSQQSEEKKPGEEEVERPGKEESSKAEDKPTTDGKVVKEEKKSKTKTTEKSKVKKVKASTQTKAKAADKTKTKTADKKETAAPKKTVKVSKKTESKQTKAKNTDSKAKSPKNKEEL